MSYQSIRGMKRKIAMHVQDKSADRESLAAWPRWRMHWRPPLFNGDDGPMDTSCTLRGLPSRKSRSPYPTPFRPSCPITARAKQMAATGPGSRFCKPVHHAGTCTCTSPGTMAGEHASRGGSEQARHRFFVDPMMCFWGLQGQPTSTPPLHR